MNYLDYALLMFHAVSTTTTLPKRCKNVSSSALLADGLARGRVQLNFQEVLHYDQPYGMSGRKVVSENVNETMETEMEMEMEMENEKSMKQWDDTHVSESICVYALL